MFDLKTLLYAKSVLSSRRQMVNNQQSETNAVSIR